MPEMLFLSEYLEGSRTAHVLKNINTNEYTVYCFCCGNEAEQGPFDSEESAENWAEDWVQGEVEQQELKATANDCGCGHSQ